MILKQLVADEPVSRILSSASFAKRTKRRGDHSSRPRFAPRLQQPTRGFLFQRGTAALKRACAQRAGPALPSYLALHHAGFSVPPVSLPERWALTPPFHPCLTSCRRRVFARLLRRHLAGFPAPCHRAALRRRSILCGTFRSSTAPHRAVPDATRRSAKLRLPAEPAWLAP